MNCCPLPSGRRTWHERTHSRRLEGRAPKVAIILGSSLGSFTDAVEDAVRISYGDLKGFPVPKISGHAGELVVGKVGGKEIAVLRGPRSCL